MSRTYAFVQVDVFTDRVFGGNPLAVVLDGRGLSDAEMQAIAGEMNLAETTFLLPVTRPDCAARVRIFTPGRELPFAGHPTVGTAWVLATRGLLAPGCRAFSLEENIGPVPVEFEGPPERPTFIWMRHRDATFGPEVADRALVARALGLAEGDLRPGVPVEVASTGNPFLFVALRDRTLVDRATPDAGALSKLPPDVVGVGVFVFAPDENPGRVYARMFAPHHGIQEDPATGSAAGPLGASLLRHGIVRASGELTIICEQGTKILRQSFLHIRLRATPEGARDLRVGGGVMPVLEGQLSLP